jgi:hypothetical protein
MSFLHHTVTLGLAAWTACLMGAFIVGLLVGLWASRPFKRPDYESGRTPYADPFKTVDGTDTVHDLARMCQDDSSDPI